MDRFGYNSFGTTLSDSSETGLPTKQSSEKNDGNEDHTIGKTDASFDTIEYNSSITSLPNYSATGFPTEQSSEKTGEKQSSGNQGTTWSTKPTVAKITSDVDGIWPCRKLEILFLFSIFF